MPHRVSIPNSSTRYCAFVCFASCVVCMLYVWVRLLVYDRVRACMCMYAHMHVHMHACSSGCARGCTCLYACACLRATCAHNAHMLSEVHKGEAGLARTHAHCAHACTNTRTQRYTRKRPDSMRPSRCTMCVHARVHLRTHTWHECVSRGGVRRSIAMYVAMHVCFAQTCMRGALFRKSSSS